MKAEVSFRLLNSPKGPIIGPMVMCGISIKEQDLALLKDIKVKDSKLLKKQERNILFEKINKISNPNISIVTPPVIDNAVFGMDGLNLNYLEALKTSEILNELNPDKAIIDLPSRNLETYKNFILKHLKNKKIELVLEHKADLNHEIVSAASIIAKVTRDNEIEKIKSKLNVDFGSGYLSDPKTKDFLKKYHDKHSEIFRKSWTPYKELIENKNQSNLTEF